MVHMKHAVVLFCLITVFTEICYKRTWAPPAFLERGWGVGQDRVRGCPPPPPPPPPPPGRPWRRGTIGSRILPPCTQEMLGQRLHPVPHPSRFHYIFIFYDRVDLDGLIHCIESDMNKDTTQMLYIPLYWGLKARVVR